VKESTTYQAIVKEGRLQEVREDIRRLGERKFKTPLPTPVRTTLEGIQDLQPLQQILERVLDAGSWDELLAAPTGQTRPARKKRT
jgi:hypothetical protein